MRNANSSPHIYHFTIYWGHGIFSWRRVFRFWWPLYFHSKLFCQSLETLHIYFYIKQSLRFSMEFWENTDATRFLLSFTWRLYKCKAQGKNIDSRTIILPIEIFREFILSTVYGDVVLIMKITFISCNNSWFVWLILYSVI